MTLPRTLCSLLVLILLGTGCATEAPLETGPPAGWQAEGDRWWRAGIDTTGAFRNLETLAAMGVTGAEVTYVASPNVAGQRVSQRAWFERAVKQELIRLYRNNPEVVDSLVERHVVPMLKEARLDGDVQGHVERLKKKSHDFLYKNYFQAPYYGRNIEAPYPEALREKEVTGTVHVQVYVDEEGKPLTVELLDGADPDLNGIAMRTMTQMEWRPAYVMGKGRWEAIPAWTRFSITFGASS